MMTDYNLTSLPDICNQDEDIKYLLEDIFQNDKITLEGTPYHQLFRPTSKSEIVKGESEPLDFIEKFRGKIQDLHPKLEQLDKKEATKKDIAAVFKELYQYQANLVLVYLSGLYRLDIQNSNGPIGWKQCILGIEIAESKDYFIQIKQVSHTDKSTLIIDTSKNCYIEPLIINQDINDVQFVSKIEKDDDVATYFKRLKFHDIELLPNSHHIDWWDEVTPTFQLKQLHLQKRSEPQGDRDIKRFISTDGSTDENFTLKIKDTNLNHLKINNHHCRLRLENKLPEISAHHCSFSYLDFKNVALIKKLPLFDDKTYIKYAVNIDQTTLSHLNSGNFDALELTRLAEFLNRNHAYMEAQELHRGYLKAKAQSENNNSVKKGLIYLYDIINSCGTSLVQPFGWLFLLFGINWYLIRYAQPSPGTVNCIYGAIKNTFPFLKIYGSKEQTIDGGIGLLLNITAALATLILFLIAIHIRKLLKLRE